MVDNSHQLDHITSTSVPEDLPDEEPPTVTPSVAPHSRPECATPGQSDHQSSECLKLSSRAETEKIVADQSSDIQLDLEGEESSRFEDECSQHLLKLEREDRCDSQEKLPTAHAVDSSMDEQCQYSQSVGPEKNKGLKLAESSKVQEDVISNIVSPLPHSVAGNVDTTSQASHSSASRNHPCSLGAVALFSNKEAPINDFGASTVADGYYDDFESTVSLPREHDQNSKPDSQNSLSPAEMKDSRKDSSTRGQPAVYDSQDEVEEEIAEEVRQHSTASEHNHQSGTLLDIYQQDDILKHQDVNIISKNAPSISPVKTPSPVTDEMPSFNIGDRVLVGSVQPGTLRFKGPTSFANGFWAGVELDKSEGSNNGTYDGVVYFECEECHGIFAPPDKITHLPDKFELYTDTTEDEDSFFDDSSDKSGNKHKENEDNAEKHRTPESKNKQLLIKDTDSEDKNVSGDNTDAPLTARSHLNSQHDKKSKHPVSNGNALDIILDFEDASHTLLISDMDKMGLVKQANNKKVSSIEVEDLDSQQYITPADLTTEIKDEKEEQKSKDLLDKFSDKLLNNFLKDTVNQFAEIKRVKEQKIKTANETNGSLFGENEEEKWISSVVQKDGLPFFLPTEKEELSSPELCNRPVSILQIFN